VSAISALADRCTLSILVGTFITGTRAAEFTDDQVAHVADRVLRQLDIRVSDLIRVHPDGTAKASDPGGGERHAHPRARSTR